MKDLQKLISEKRAEFYIRKAEESGVSPFEVYTKNIRISQKFYHLMHFTEIILRNKIAKHLNKNWEDWYAPSSYFANNVLHARHKGKLEQAYERILADKKDLNVDTMISELNFGFWTSLCDKAYAQDIWKNSTLKHVFPNTKKIKFGQISTDLDRIRKFRNRIFHYEQILTYNHEKIREIIIEYLKYMINPKANILEQITTI